MTITYGVNIVGSLTNNNGILSGFSTSAYAKLPSSFTPSNDKWEIVLNFTTGNDITSEQWILSNKWYYYSGSYSQQWGVFIGVNNGNLITQACNGAVNSRNNPCFVNHTYSISTNTQYKIRFVYDSTTTTYSSYITVGGGEETLINSTVSSTVITQDSTYLPILGLCYAGHNNTYFGQFKGSIDLNNSYIKIGNDIWWRGAHTYNGTHIQLRRDVAANWTTFNPVLLQGEVGLELDTGKSKRGNGTTAWNSLAYDKASTALQSITSSDVTTALGYTPYNSTNPNSYVTKSDVLFIAEYGTTTYAEIGAALAAGKDVILHYTETWGDTYAKLDYYQGNYNYYSFSDFTGSAFNQFNVDNSNTWSVAVRAYSDTDLSNLSATGQTVLDGQWVAVSWDVKVNYTLAAGASESWTLSLPNDSYTYEVMGTVTASGTGTGGIGVSVKSAIVNTNICRAVSLNGQSSTFTIPIGTDHKIGLTNINTNNTATINYLRVFAYRRIGTNS